MANQTVTVKVTAKAATDLVDTGLEISPTDSLRITVTGRIVFRRISRKVYTYPEGVYYGGGEHDNYDRYEDGALNGSFTSNDLVLFGVNDNDTFIGNNPDRYYFDDVNPYSLGVFIGSIPNQSRLQGLRDQIIEPLNHSGGIVKLFYNRNINTSSRDAEGFFEVTIEKIEASDSETMPTHQVSPIRFVPSILLAKKQSTNFATAYFWYIKPKYGPAEAYTSWDNSLYCPAYVGEFGLQGNEVPAMRYKKNHGVDLSQIPTSMKNDVRAPDVKAIRLDWKKVLNGYYQGAYVEIFEADPEGDAPARIERTLWVVGEMGQLQLGDNDATIEIIPMSEFANREVGRRVQPICDVGRIPGETALRGRCRNMIKLDGPDVLDWTRGGIVDEVFSEFKLRFFSETVNGFPGYESSFPGSFGRVRGVTGENAGVVRDIGDFDGSTGLVTLRRALPIAPNVYDQFEIEAGCDGTFAMCKDRWNNLKNARFFVYVPGRAALLRTIKAG